MERPKHSTIAWSVLATSVFAYDYLCPEGEMLSEACDNMIERPLTRALLYGAVGGVALHLVNAIPEEYDPIHRLSKLKGRRGTIS